MKAKTTGVFAGLLALVALAFAGGKELKTLSFQKPCNTVAPVAAVKTVSPTVSATPSAAVTVTLTPTVAVYKPVYRVYPTAVPTVVK